MKRSTRAVLSGRGGLKREQHKRFGPGARSANRGDAPDQRTSRFVDPMIMISERPAESRTARSRWGGDLIMGSQQDRDRDPGRTHHPLRCWCTCPRTSRRSRPRRSGRHDRHLRPGSLTWDRGCEMARHQQFAMAHRPRLLLRPASPWQRGTNENTNGCCVFPKGTDLSVFSPADLELAQQLGRPAKRSTGIPQALASIYCLTNHQRCDGPRNRPGVRDFASARDLALLRLADSSSPARQAVVIQPLRP